MKNIFRRSAVLLLALVLLLNCAPVALADASEDPPGETTGEQATEPAPETPEVPQEPAPEVTAEPAPEVTAEPAPEVTAEPVPEVTAEPVPEVTAEPTGSPEATADPAASPEPSTSPEPSASPEPAADLAAVQAMVDALPDGDALLTMGKSAQDAVYTQLQAAYDAFMALPEDQQALVTGAEKFQALFDIFNAMISTVAWYYEYYDPSDGQMHGVPENNYSIDIVPMMKDPSLLAGYWFVVRSDLTINKQDRGMSIPLPVTGSGEVNILLMDGATLTINKGIKFTSAGQSVTIWGQSSQTGKLEVVGEYNPAIDGGSYMGSLTVNGGVVDIRTRTSQMITSPSVTVNAGDVDLNYINRSDNGPLMSGGTLTIAPGAYVSGGGVEKNAPVNGAAQRVFPVTVAQLQEMTKSWRTTYTLDGAKYTYRTGSHSGCALWLTAGEHTLVMENGENITLTIGEDGAVSWSSTYTEQTSYYDPSKGMQETNAKPVTESADYIDSGWYVVNGTVDHYNYPLRIRGDVNMILATGSTLSSRCGIWLEPEASLTIWGQNENTGNDGVINVTNENINDHYFWGYSSGTFYDNYIMNPAIGGGASFTLTINGGQINATANHSNNSAPAVGAAGTEWGAGPSVVTVNRGSLTAAVTTGIAPAIGVGVESNCNFTLNVNGGTVTANQSGSSNGTYYAIGPCPFFPGFGTSHVNMNGGSLTADGGRSIGISGGVTYRGGVLAANGNIRALAEVPDFTAMPHVTTDNRGRELESTSQPRSQEEWATWKNVTIKTETLTGELKLISPGSIEVANGSVTAPLQVTWDGEPWMDKVQWVYPDGFTLDDQWRLHVEDDVALGTYTVTARYGDRTVTIQVRVTASAYYYDPDTGKTYPVPQLQDIRTVDHTLDNGWYFSPEYSYTVIVKDGASANLLLEDDTETRFGGVTLGKGATLTIWGQEKQNGKLSFSAYSTMGAADSNAIVINGGTIDATNADVRSPIWLRDGAVVMNSAPAAGITAAGGSLKLKDATGAKAQDPAGNELVCAPLPNADGAAVFIDGQEYRPVDHTGLDSSDAELYPWLTAEDHIVQLGDKSYKFIYDSGDGTFRLSEPLSVHAYYDPIKGESKELTEYTPVTEETTELKDGWYVVDHTVTVPDRIVVHGKDVNLVLANGVLNANSGINVDPGNALTIWSTEADYTGRRPGQAALQADASHLERAAGIGGADGPFTRCGDITINGGRVYAIGGYLGGAGIGGGLQAAGTADGAITINAGSVYAAVMRQLLPSNTGGLGGGALKVVINGGIVTASGYRTSGISANGSDYGSCKTNLVVNGGSVYSTPAQFYGVTYDVAADVTNDAGQPLYLLKLYNPYGKTVFINSEKWNMAGSKPVHDHGLDETIDGFEADYLYAYVPLYYDRLVHVQMGDQTYTYALVDGALQLVDETKLGTADYYDPEAGETRTAARAARLSSLTPDENDVYHVQGSESLTWFLADQDLEGKDLLISGDVDLILQDGVMLRSNVNLDDGAALTIWGQSAQTGTLSAKAHPGAGAGSLTPGLLLGSGASVTINGGVIDALGENDAGEYDGPGIGNVTDQYGGTITINYGTVTAQGGNIEPGIGGSGIVLVIKDGTVNAIGGPNAPGIGTFSNPTVVTIEGGTVTATGGKRAPGIGNAGTAPLSLTITGGVVKATGGEGAPGIGLRNNSDGTSMHFDGGTITAQGGPGAPGISAPGTHMDFTIDGDTVKILGSAMPLQPYDRAGEPVYLLTLANPDERGIRINGKEWTPAKPFNHDENAHDGDTNLYLYLPGRDVSIGTYENGVPVATEYAFDETTKTFVVKEPFPYYDPKTGETRTHPAVPVKAELTTWHDGGWYVVDSALTIDTRITVEGNVNLILADGGSLTMGRYHGIAVNEGSSLTIWGQAGQTGRLTVPEAPYAYAGIGSDPGHDAGPITINGGVIDAHGGTYGAGIGGCANGGAGNITINYGTVKATGGGDSYGRGGAGVGTGWDNTCQNMNAGSVTITGGTVTAIGAGVEQGGTDGGGAGIGTGDRFAAGAAITITGGTITAQGGAKAYGIGAGRYSRYSGGATVITGGSVKSTGALGPVNPRPTNGEVDVYLLTVPNPDGSAVTLGGTPWSPVNHSALGDNDLYAYIPGADVLADAGGVQTQYLFENGVFTAAADYDWESGTWTWSDDGASATLTIPRTDGKDPALTRTVLTNVTAETKPTCLTAGTRTYTARTTVHGKSYEGSRKVDTDPATGHNWDVTGQLTKPTLSDTDSRTVTVYCLNDPSHTCTATLRETEIKERYKAPDCHAPGTDGEKVYARWFTLDGVTYDFDELTLPVKASHTWGPWQEVGGSEAVITLARKCDVCGAEETSDHWHQWQLPSNEPYGNTDNVRWQLGPDEYSVTVHVTCAVEGCEYSENGEKHGMDISIDPNLFKPAEGTEPSCETEGTAVYKVTLELPVKGGTVKQTYYSDEITLPATGHNWGDPKFTFKKTSSDPYDASEAWTLTLTCQNNNCGMTQKIEGQGVTGEETTAPTCDKAGAMKVTAETVYEGVTYTSEPQTRTIPAAGHDYTTAAAAWNSDHTSAVVTLTCARNEDHTTTVEIPASAITRTKTEPTCDARGATIYSFDAAQAIADEDITFSGNTLFSDSVPIDALGHDWDVLGDKYPLETGVDGNYTTLTIFCKRDKSHTQTVYPQLKLVREVQATCATEGSEVYKMTFEVNGQPGELPEQPYPIPTLPHTWGEWKISTDESGNTIYIRECTKCPATETADHQHEYILGSASWNVVNGQPLSVTVQAVCQTCGKVQELTYTFRSGDIKIDVENTIKPTCTAEGRTVYTVTAKLDGEEKTYIYSQPVPALDHTWDRDEAAGGLSDDRSMYTFVFKCKECGNTVAKTVPTVTEILTPATCEEPGEMNYRADLEMGGQRYSFTEKERIPAIGHDWDPEGVIVPRTMETEDGLVTVTIFCRNDHSHAQTVYAARTLVEGAGTDATCTEPGLDVYTLSYIFDLKTYYLPQMVEYAIPPLGHLWDENGKCKRCGKQFEGAEGVTYTWDLPDPNDTTGRVLWSDPPAGGRPYLTLKVYRNGSDGSRVQEEVIIKDVKVNEHLSCKDTGWAEYTAEVTVGGGKSMTYTKRFDDLPPTGHLLTFDETKDVKWNDDNTATFTLRCKNPWHPNNEPIETKTVPVSTSETPATCDKTGKLVYTASTQLDGTTATATRTVTLERLGHIWDTKNYTTVWSEDYTTAAFTFTCLRDESHTRTETVNAERTTLKAADCTTDGLDRWSASYTMEDGTTVTAYQDVVTPALGHDYKDGVCTRCKEKDPNYKAPTATPAATAAATKAPNTGDETALLPWTVLLLACAAALAVVLRLRRRRQ